MTQVPTARLAVARTAAILLMGLAVYWIFVFTQTDFRPQRRSLYLPIAAFLLPIGGGVWLRYRWAFIASLLVAALGLAFTCLMLVGAPANAALWGQALVLVVYLAVVGPLGFPRRGD